MGRLALPDDVQKDRAFSSACGDEEWGVRGVFKDLEALSIDDQTYDHSVNFNFVFQEETLRANLEATDRLASVDLDHLITTFLSEASRLGPSFRSLKTGREAIDSLPISQSVFQAPQHFQKPIDALCQSGFCAKVDSGYLWTASVRPFMERAHLWFGDRTHVEIREQELVEIWDAMPSKLRHLVTQNRDGILDVLNFAMAMSHLWYNGKWHEKPERYDNLGPDSLKGSCLSTANEMGRLYKEGKLKV